MSDCQITITHKAIAELIGTGPFKTMADIENAILDKLQPNGVQASFRVEGKATTLTVYLFEFTAAASPSGTFTTNAGDFDLGSFLSWDTPIQDPVTLEDPAIRLEANIAGLATTTEEDLPEDKGREGNKFIKFDLMATTTYDAENNILDSSPIKKAQRWLTKEVADNQAKYKLVMMADVDGIMKPENFNPEQRGQVLLVVPVGSDPTPENILDIALKYDNEVVPLYFEAPLTSDVSTNSFFGNLQVNKLSRDQSVHQERLEKISQLTDKPIEQIQREYEQEFRKLQELRKQPFTVLSVSSVSKGFRVPNDRTFLRLPQEYHTPVLDTNTETGILTATYFVDGQKVNLEVFGKPLTEGEIEYLVNNLGNINNPEVRAVFELILGNSKRANSFFFHPKGTLQFNQNKATQDVTTPEQFKKLLEDNPYRNRSKTLADLYQLIKHPAYSSIREYFLENFYPSTTMFIENGKLSPDLANQYISFKPITKTGLDGIMEARIKLEKIVYEQVEKAGIEQIELEEESIIEVDGQVEGTKEKLFMSSVNTLGQKQVKELQIIAKALGLKSTGKKQELIDAIREKSFGGLYSNGKVWFFPDSKLEEAIHSLTADWLDANQDSAEYQRLTKLRQRALDLATKKGVTNKMVLYSLSDNYEFIARGLSHPATIQFLTEVAPQHWFDKISQLVKDILSKLGIDAPNPVFAELTSLYERIVEIQQAPPIITPVKTEVNYETEANYGVDPFPSEENEPNPDFFDETRDPNYTDVGEDVIVGVVTNLDELFGFEERLEAKTALKSTTLAELNEKIPNLPEYLSDQINEYVKIAFSYGVTKKDVEELNNKNLTASEIAIELKNKYPKLHSYKEEHSDNVKSVQNLVRAIRTKYNFKSLDDKREESTTPVNEETNQEAVPQEPANTKVDLTITPTKKKGAGRRRGAIPEESELSDPTTQLEIGRAMDSLFLSVLDEAKVSLVTIYDAKVKFHEIYPKFVLSLDQLERKGDFINFFKKNEDAVRSIWLRNSRIWNSRKVFELPQDIEEDPDSHVESVEEGKAEKEFDKKGNETASFDLISSLVKSVYSTLPTGEKDRFGMDVMSDPKDVHYDIMDMANGAVSLFEVVKRLSYERKPHLKALYKRLPVMVETFADDMIELESDQANFLEQWYRALHKPELPFMLYTESGEKRWPKMVQITGNKTDTVLSLAYARFRKKVIGTNMVNEKDGRFTVNENYRSALKSALDNQDAQEFAELLGFNYNVDNIVRRQLLSATKFLKGNIEKMMLTDDPFKALNSVEGSMFSIYNMLVDEGGRYVKKTRMVVGPDGQPVSSDTLPNSITQIVDLVNSLDTIDGVPELPATLGFLKTPRFQNSISYQRLNKRGKLEVFSYGGIPNEGTTADLKPGDWLKMNIASMLKEGYMEMMRTETSSSSWAFRWKDYPAFVRDGKDYLDAQKGYFKGEIETMFLGDPGIKPYFPKNFVKLQSASPEQKQQMLQDLEGFFSYFDYLSDVTKVAVLEAMLISNDSTQIVEQVWPAVSEEVKRHLFENIADVNEAIAEYQLDLPQAITDIPNYVEKFTMNYLIANTEESILFNGGLDFYGDFHKRAKAKVSTGPTPISDPEYWKYLSSSDYLLTGSEEVYEETLAQALGLFPEYTPQFKTFNVLEDVVTYGDRVEYIDGRAVVVNPHAVLTGMIDGMVQGRINQLIQTGKVARYYKKGQIDYLHTDYLPYYNDMVNKAFGAYGKMKIADGAGYINMDYYRAFQRSVGNWPREAEEHYQWEVLFFKKYYLGQALHEDQEKFFKSRAKGYAMSSSKWSYFGPDVERGLPVFDKFSLIPLVPSVMYGKELGDMVKVMAMNDIAYFKMQSGTKAAQGTQGQMAPVRLFGVDRSPLFSEESGQFQEFMSELTTNQYTLDVSFLKEQLRTDNKVKEKNIFGSQFRKLMFSDVMESGVPRDFIPTDEAGYKEFVKKLGLTVKKYETLTNTDKFTLIRDYWKTVKSSPMYDRMKKYEKYQAELSQSYKEKLLGELGIVEEADGYLVTDFQKFISTIEKKTDVELDVVQEFLDMNKHSNDSLLIPFEASPARQTFENLLTGMFKKELVRQKAPGGQLTQVPSTGFETKGFKLSENVSPTGLRNYQIKDGKVLPAQIKISLHGPFKNLLNRPDVKELARTEGLSKLDALNQLLRNEEWVSKNSAVIRVMGYRIPTQGLSSMEAYEVLEFLPEQAGKTIVLPLEIVGKSGGDYDIDKMSMVFPNLLSNGEIFETYTGDYSKSRVKEILKRNKELNNLIKEISKSKKGVWEQIQDLKRRETIEGTLEEKKSLIRQRHEQMKALNQEAAPYFQERESNMLELLEQEENKLGKIAELQNNMMNVMYEQLLDVNNFHQLTTPLSTDDIKGDLQAEGTKHFGNIPSPTRYQNLTFKTNLQKRIALLTGKQLLGIAAVANTFNQLYQGAGLRVQSSTPLRLLTDKERESILEGEWLNVSSQFTLDNKLKSELFNEFVNATVDAAKEDYLGFANFTKQTMPIVMAMIQFGVPTDRVFKFIGSKPIRDLIRNSNVSNFGMKDTLDNYIDNALEAYTGLQPEQARESLKEQTLPPEISQLLGKQKNLEVMHDLTTLPEMSRPVNWNEKESLDFYLEGISMLVHFKELQKISSDMLVVSQALNFDTKPISSPIEAFKYELKYQAALKTIVDPQVVTRIKNESIISSFSNHEEYAKLMKAAMPFLYSTNFIKYMANVKVPKGVKEDEFYRVMANDFTEYLVKERSVKDGLPLSQWGLEKLQQEKLNIPESLQSLRFFRDLGIITAPDGTPALRLTRDAQDTEYNNAYSRDLKKAYELEPEFTTDIILMGFLQTGYNRTYYSWSDLIPPSLISPILGEVLNSPPTIAEIKDFNTNFVRNNRQFYPDEDGQKRKTAYKYKKVKKVAQEVAQPSQFINIYAGTGENVYLSNLAVRPFTFDEIKFNSVEQAYQSLKGGKFDKETYDNKAYIPFNRNGNMTVSKFRGPMGTTTDAEQTQLMKQLIKASFQQNPDAFNKLLATGNAILTHTQDTGKWGTEFPRLLMEVRQELQPIDSSITNIYSQLGSKTTVTFKTYKLNGVPIKLSTFKNGVEVPIELSQGQAQALQVMADFVDENVYTESPNHFLLQGKAGTGKTTVIKLLNDYFQTKYKDKTTIVTPTHKAGVNAAKATYNNNDSYGTVASTFYNPFAARPKLILVDEISMIGDYSTKILLEKSKAEDIMLVIMGDKGQIPPVMSGEYNRVSPLFDVKDTFELTEVLRFDEQGPIFSIADTFRENLKVKDPIQQYPAYLSNGIETVTATGDKEKFIEHILDTYEAEPDRTQIRVITYSNNSVKSYSDAIRNRLYGNRRGDFNFDITPFEGEPLMGNAAWSINSPKKLSVLNSIDYTVVKSEPDKIVRYQQVPIKGTGIALKRSDIQREYYVTVVDPTAPQNLPLLEKIALNYYKLSKLPEGKKWSSEPDQILFDIESKGFYLMAPIYAKVVGETVTILPTNVGANIEVTPNLAFGYALTDHKAQGSTYKTAFVDEDNMSIVTRTIKDRDGSFYSFEANNMKYVGFSRPSTNLHIFTKKPIVHQEREKLDYSDSPTKIIYDILKKTKLNTFSVTRETGMKINQDINASWVKNSSLTTIQTLAGDIASQYPYMDEQEVRDIIIDMVQHTPAQYEKRRFGAITEDFISTPNINFQLKEVDILMSDKAKQVFNKGQKAGWSLDKILIELQIPKEQKQLILDLQNNMSYYEDIPFNEQLALELASKYSYAVEVKTAKTSRVLEDTPTATTVYRNFEYNGDNFTKTDELEFDGEYKEVYRKNGKQIKRPEFIEFAKKAEQIRVSVPTTYYSNLTVSGGTNYTEQEIATPAITPSIKGHAQFATSSGIGWFRSDDVFQLGSNTGNTISFPSIDGQETITVNEQRQIPSKTRRILEVQSDLFQKWRNNFEFKSNKYTAKKDEKNVWKYYKNGNEINANEYIKTWEIFLDTYLDNADAFTKLLQKDNNWVTFFIKSIIQDSAKKGYEKVLFPSGNTASKVEGHTNLEEFKKQKEDRIKELEKTSSFESAVPFTKNGIKYTKENGKIFKDHPSFGGKVEVTENELKEKDERVVNEIAQLKQELERVETEGFGALKPIYNFYEDVVTNILKKQYGKENVKLITDEYGNTWNEIVIDKRRDLGTILLGKGTANMPYMAIPKETYDNPELSRIFAFNPPPYDGLPEENFRCDD